MSEAPKNYCPKLGREAPVWYCLGSYIQRREKCQHIIKATVHGDIALVECDYEDYPKVTE